MEFNTWKDYSVYIYSLSGDKVTETASLKGHKGAVCSLAYSADGILFIWDFNFPGKFLASGDYNRELLIWDAQTKTVKMNGLVFHTGRINSVSFSPDSKHVATGGLDNAIYVWSVEDSGKRICVRGKKILGKW